MSTTCEPHRATLRDALAQAFPHAYEAETDDGTVAPDPPGAGAPPRSTPPCTGAMVARLEAHLECLAAECSTVPGSMGGQITDIDCLPSCDATHALLHDEADAQQRCHGCFHAHLWSDATWAEAEARCTTMNEPLAYEGDAGLLVLSRLPVDAAETLPLPSSRTRRAVATVRVRTPGGHAMDVHCTGLDDPLRHDYDGRFGDAESGYATQHALQIGALVDRVVATDASVTAVVLGQVVTSHAYTGAGGVPIAAVVPAQADRLGAALSLAVPPGFVPACTICPENPLVAVADRLWVNPAFVRAGQGATVSVDEATRTWLGHVVPVTSDDGDAARVPLAIEYGFRARLRLE